jgi:hypothetical protein
VAAFALPDERAARRSQQVPDGAVELRSHSGGRGLRFAQRGELQIDRSGIDAGMIVR